MKYIAHSSPRTLVVAGTPRRCAVISMGRILVDQGMKDDGGMLRVRTGEMLDLMAAGGARRGQQLARLQRTSRRKQPPFANLLRNLVVVLRIAERAGHAAAARIEIDDRARRNAREQRLRGRDQPHRLLMTMAVQHDRRWSGLEIERQAAGGELALEIVLEQNAGIGDEAGAALLLAAQQRGRILADGRQAARLEEEDLLATRRGLVERVGIFLRELARGVELARRYKGSAAAVVRQQLHAGARRLEHRRRRDAILGFVVVGKGVVEKNDPTPPTPPTREARPNGFLRPRRRGPAAVDREQFLVHPPAESARRHRIGERRELTADLRQPAHVAEDPL